MKCFACENTGIVETTIDGVIYTEPCNCEHGEEVGYYAERPEGTPATPYGTLAPEDQADEVAEAEAREYDTEEEAGHGDGLDAAATIITMTPDQAQAEVARLNDCLMAIRVYALERMEALSDRQTNVIREYHAAGLPTSETQATAEAKWKLLDAERQAWSAAELAAQNAGNDFVNRWQAEQAAK